jgi:hypothetical protein
LHEFLSAIVPPWIDWFTFTGGPGFGQRIAIVTDGTSNTLMASEGLGEDSCKNLTGLIS